MRLIGWLGAAALVVGGAAPALSQNIYISQLYNQVLENSDVMGPGYALDSFGVQRMLPGGKLRIPVEVPANASIAIMGDCDQDCVDLDLRVFDAQGVELGSDVLADNYPVVSVQVRAGTRVEVELDMVNCDAVYCYAAYSVFIGG